MTAPRLTRIMGYGVQIQVAVWPGQGKPVLCIHGLTANCRNWDPVARNLAPDHLLLAMDLRGRGRSEQPPSGYDIEHHCRDIEALAHSFNMPSFALMGHSLGAYIALAFAAKHPEQVERIILVDGGGKLSEDQTQKVLGGIQESLNRIGKVFPSFQLYRQSLQKAPFLQPWLPAMDVLFQHEIEEVEEGVRSRVHASTIQEELSNLLEFDVSELYALVACPVLILRAKSGMLTDDDILLPDDVLDRMLREIPNARCVDVEAVNHYTILFQEHEARDRAIRTFLSERES